MHRLLDLLCATNSGKGAFQTFATLSNSDEEYFLDELNKRSEYQDKGATKPASALRLHSNSETAAVEGDESGSSQGDLVAQSDGDVDRSASSELHEREMEHMEPAPAADVWLLHSPAEQLFVREREVLSTVAAYCSLIRGAAKFNNPSRALEVADLAWNGPEGNGALDVVTYCTLIRSLHHLPAVKSGDEDVWEYLKSLLNRLATSGEPVNDFVFSSSIYVLANVAQKNGDRPYASNALPLGFGLLSEMQKLGISPSLGVAARLLQLIESTEQSDVKSMPRRSNQAGFSGYSCATFLHSFLTEMELRFTACSPSRFDDWSIDDYFFFPVAMQMAVRENNLDLALRINHLLEDNSDRRYLLRTSLHNRNYFQDYCRLTLRRYPSDNASPLKAVQRFRDVYAMQCDTVCASYRLCTQLLRGLAFYLQWKDNRATRDSKSCERELHTMSYTLLCTLTNDLLATVRSSGPVRLSENICYAIAVLSSHAHLDRPTAASISGRILDRFLQADDKSLLANDQLSQCSVDSQTIEQIVRLAFPPQADSEADRWGSGGGSNATVSGWLGYSASHQLLSWNWTPQALVISWTDENGCDM